MGVRYFSGGRDQKARKPGALGQMEGNTASALMRIEILKKGKMPANERYKQILKSKLAASREKAMMEGPKSFSLPGSKAHKRQMSKKAELALKQIAMKKAAKEAKAMRRMVLITPRTYPTGKLDQRGKVYDVAGNMIATVNRKNGKIATTMGWNIGKYKPKSYFTDMMLQDAIQKYSPYYINLRKMQHMQGGGDVTSWGPAGGETVSVYGRATGGGGGGGHHHQPQTLQQAYGTDVSGPRQQIGMTAWGAASDNVFGTFTDNVWGGSLDNVWGGNSSDVWGGIGIGNLWGVKGHHVWGTGNGTNYLKGLSQRVAAFFGLGNKMSKESRNKAVETMRNKTASRVSSAATRSVSVSSAPSRSAAPTTSRR